MRPRNHDCENEKIGDNRYDPDNCTRQSLRGSSYHGNHVGAIYARSSELTVRK